MATKANLVIDQGTTFTTTIDVTNDDGNYIDLTGYTGAAQIRKTYSSSNSTAFTVVVSNAGTVTLSLNANTTANITAGRYVYDCEITNADGIRSRIIEGIVTITPEVTR
jgi:hypothetical protein